VSKDKSFSHVTESGLAGIGIIPFGAHFCHFYRKRQDLVDLLVPFFQTGLRNNERCLWITADPFPADEARAELAKVLPDFDDFLRKGAIRIAGFQEWYLSAQGVDSQSVLAHWIREEEAALTEGYQGLRISGNAGFPGKQNWTSFMEYEHRVNRVFQARRIVALCSYDLLRCEATDVFEVVRNHQHTLDRRDDGWEILEGPFAPPSRL
jgi:DcmR-like sensory protein